MDKVAHVQYILCSCSLHHSITSDVKFHFCFKRGQVWLCQSCFPGPLRIDLLYSFRMITRMQNHCCCVGSNGDHAAEGGQSVCGCWPACQGTCAALLPWRPEWVEITTLDLDTHPVVSLMHELESTLMIYFEKSKQNIIEVRSDEKWLHLLSGVGVE